MRLGIQDISKLLADSVKPRKYLKYLGSIQERRIEINDLCSQKSQLERLKQRNNYPSVFYKMLNIPIFKKREEKWLLWSNSLELDGLNELSRFFFSYRSSNMV